MPSLKDGQFLNVFRSLVWDCEDILEIERGTLDGDFEVISSSVKSRGLTILLVDLPSLSKILEGSLEDGRYKESLGKIFHRKGFPRLFLPIYHMIFTEDWVLLDKPNPIAVSCLRQIFKIFKKYEAPCPDSAVQETIHEFADIETRLPLPSLSWGDDCLVVRRNYPCLIDMVYRNDEQFDISTGTGTHIDRKEQGSSELFRDLSYVQYAADKLLRSFQFRAEWFRPKHGPGAVAERFEFSKYEFPSWSQRLEQIFPYFRHGCPNEGMLDLSPYDGSDPPAKLIDVPKDYTRPRLIASEPIASQFIQQGIMKVLRENVRRSPIRYSVDFSSQEPSRALALSSSADRSLSTIDLSSASDRLSCAVVECFFRKNYKFLEMLNAARTPDILYPDGQIMRSKKFAAQGAAFTFPIQSIIYAIACYGVIYSSNPGSRWVDIAKRVRVYGDDMIVPTDLFDRICNVLEALHLKVNREKSFSKGGFRESCGMDAFEGVNVTPANILQFFDMRAPASTVSVIACSNNLYIKGFIRAALTLQETIPWKIRKDIPFVKPDSTIAGFWGSGKSALKKRFNSAWQIEEVRILTVDSKVTKTTIDGPLRLFQWFIENPHPESVWKSGEVVKVKARYRLRWVDASRVYPG